METKTITLKSGIILKDSRSLGCGISIENQNTKYIHLSYSSTIGFYLNMTGFWLTIDNFQEYHKELDTMRISLVEANELIK
jgi:hypothetical protein